MSQEVAGNWKTYWKLNSHDFLCIGKFCWHLSSQKMPCVVLCLEYPWRGQQERYLNLLLRFWSFPSQLKNAGGKIVAKWRFRKKLRRFYFETGLSRELRAGGNDVENENRNEALAGVGHIREDSEGGLTSLVRSSEVENNSEKSGGPIAPVKV